MGKSTINHHFPTVFPMVFPMVFPVVFLWFLRCLPEGNISPATLFFDFVWQLLRSNLWRTHLGLLKMISVIFPMETGKPLLGEQIDIYIYTCIYIIHLYVYNEIYIIIYICVCLFCLNNKKFFQAAESHSWLRLQCR